MLMISRTLDVDWMSHHDHVIDEVMSEFGFKRTGSGSDFKTRDMEFEHESFEEEQRFYNLGLIDRVAERLPGIGLEVRLLPYHSQVN